VRAHACACVRVGGWVCEWMDERVERCELRANDVRDARVCKRSARDLQAAGAHGGGGVEVGGAVQQNGRPEGRPRTPHGPVGW